jgi:hypothetical protein
MNTLEKLLLNIFDTSKMLGLNSLDLKNAKDLLDNQEYGLAFDTLITQLYEYEIGIDKDFFFLLESIAKKLNIPDNEYSFMKELIN